MATERPNRSTPETFDTFMAREIFIHGDSRLKKNKIDSLMKRFSAQKQETLSTFFNREIPISPPPKELFDIMLRAREIGWFQAEPHFLPELTLEQDSEIPGWKVKPEQWFWTCIEKGLIPKDTATLRGIWVIVDGTPKPEVNSALHIPEYENDPFVGILDQLRYEGKIEGRIGVVQHSRFYIRNDALRNHVYPAIASLLGIQSEQVRSLRAIEYNFLGNLSHPEWATYTAEWLDDVMLLSPCIGGFNRDGKDGLTSFKDVDPTVRRHSIGFRPMIVFPIAA